MINIKTPTIVQPGSRKLPLMLLLLLMLLLVLGWYIFDLGRVQGGFVRDQAAQETGKLLQQINRQHQDIADLRGQSARYKREAQVEREAGRRLQQALVELRKEGDELTNEVVLLRSLMSKNSGSFYIKRFEVYATEKAARYKYHLIIAQALDNVGITKGKLIISIVGKQDGKSKRLSQKQFSDNSETSVALKFKHYQDVRGFINLQEGFEPESVEMEIQPNNRKLSNMNKQFPWKLIEFGSDGQEVVDAGA